MSTTESSVQLVPISEAEMVQLLHECISLDLAFGAGGCAVRWDTNLPMPRSIQRLREIRGISNLNMHGAGI